MKTPGKHPDRINEGILLEIYRQYEKDEVVMLLMNEHKLLRIENGILRSEYQEKMHHLITENEGLKKRNNNLRTQLEDYKEKHRILYREKYNTIK